VWPVLPVSLDCPCCFVCLRLVWPVLPVSIDCFCFVCLRLVCLCCFNFYQENELNINV
jgi:hypothetical protein